MNTPCLIRLGLMLLGPFAFPTALASAQVDLRSGTAVPPDVEQITGNALRWLAENQLPSGNWPGGDDPNGSTHGKCGVTGLAVTALLATGADPNSGEYAPHVRAALRYIIAHQNPRSGFLPNSMYNHGFGMLALAEAYGYVDDELLWQDAGVEVPPDRRRTIAEALRLAVRCAVTSQQNNPFHAWRYTPEAKDADVSVTGAVLVGLLAAKNAGIRVPDQSLTQAMEYIRSLTDKHGGVGYTVGFGGIANGSNMAAVATLVFAISNHKDWPEYRLASQFVARSIDETDNVHLHYNLYSMAQALFQCDYESWTRWNQNTIRRLRRMQNDDGSFDSDHGKAYATSMACLALALNYRFLPIYER